MNPHKVRSPNPAQGEGERVIATFSNPSVVTWKRVETGRGARKSGAATTFVPKDVVERQEDVRVAYRLAVRDPKFLIAGGDPFRAWRLHILAYVPDRRRRDVDNIDKLIQDALNRTAYYDDTQIEDLRVVKRLASVTHPPLTIVRLSTLGPKI